MRRILVGAFKITEEEKRAVNEVLDSGRISESASVREFEKTFDEYIGSRYPVAVNSVTGVLVIGMAAIVHHEEAMHNAKIAISEWIETAKSLGREIPVLEGKLAYA
jgi:dTDP-4-amino-4,6-dideoxygalactose transaminase